MKLLRTIASFFYSIGVRFRNWLYDMGIKKSLKFDIPVVCVGNLTVGGTGKTPVVEFLVERLSADYKIAILSRGYKRRTKGYQEVKVDSSFLDVGDEPKQIKRKYPHITVVVCEDRCHGVERIRQEHPEVTLVLMDDGFQHRRISPKVNIVLMDYNRPIYRDHMLPRGGLRDSPSQLSRANIIIVTKTPPSISPIDRRLVVKKLKLYPYQRVYFTTMKQSAPMPVFADMAPAAVASRNAAVLSGIGNPRQLVDSVAERYNICAEFSFRDHHVYKVKELRSIAQKLEDMPSDTIIITTEKDAVKLRNRKKVPEEIQRRLYVIPVELSFYEGDEKMFITNLNKDVRSRED